MTIRHVIVGLAAFAALAAAAAQTRIAGRVVEKGGECLPYATVKVKNRYLGAVADSVGLFEIQGAMAASDTVVVSYMGFRTRKLLVAELGVSDSTVSLVEMESAPVPLPEVAVRPGKRKTVKYGKKHGTGMLSADYTAEAGLCTGFETKAGKGRTMWLDAVGFYIKEIPGMLSSMKFRINIYDMAGVTREPTDEFADALVGQIYFDYDKADVVDGRYTWYLPEMMRLPEHAMVEIEFLENRKNEAIVFKCNLLGKNSWIREHDEYFWCTCPIATPFFVSCVEN